MAVMILIAGALIGVLLGRIFKVAILAPVSLAAAGLAAVGGLSEMQSALLAIGFAVAVPMVLQLGYLVGLTTMPAAVRVRRNRAPF